MIDMAQADKTLYRTAQVKPANIWAVVTYPYEGMAPRSMCVIRSSNGSPEVLRLADQQEWKEWVGVFSYLGERYEGWTRVEV